ncbi:MAG: cobyrinic acid a,c-diamide synthase, partial [Halobacteriales archaeon]
HVRTAALIETAREPPEPAREKEPNPSGKRVAVASDAAFAFRYPATAERLRRRAEVVTFAPTAGDALPDADGVYLPGGYPELHAEALSESPAIRSLREAAAAGTAILGECGGFMVLAEALTTADGETHEMAGVLPATVRMHDRYQALDHVELAARTDSPIAETGQQLRGHEFHNSSADLGRDARFAFDMERGEGMNGQRDGLQEYRTLGTYCHFHAESGAFDTFIDAL